MPVVATWTAFGCATFIADPWDILAVATSKSVVVTCGTSGPGGDETVSAGDSWSDPKAGARSATLTAALRGQNLFFYRWRRRQGGVRVVSNARLLHFLDWNQSVGVVVLWWKEGCLGVLVCDQVLVAWVRS